MLSEEIRKENHRLCLLLLDKFIEICEKNNIVYYFSEGSAIGVMRHQGFIPWDINVDVVLSVEEYSKLDKAMGKEDLGEFKWCAPKKLGRICKFLMRKDSLDYETKPNIDIAIYGSASDNKLIRSFSSLHSFLNIKMYKLKNTPVNRKFPFNILKGISSLFPDSFYLNTLNRMKKKGKKRNVKYMMALTPSFFGNMELIETNWIGTKPTYGKFEGRKVRIFEKCHEYLTHRYGDYMTPVVWEDKGEYEGCFYNRK